MKNIFHFVTIFLLIPLVVFSQTDTEKQKEWRVFSPQSEEFSVEVPGTLTGDGFSTDSENLRYTALIDGTYYFIFSDSKKESFQYKTVMKFVENNQKTELENQKDSAIMKFSFSDDEDFYHTIYTAKTKNHLYTFHLVSASEDDPAVERFFKSLKLYEQTSVDDVEDSKTETVNKITVIDSTESKKEGSNGSGIGYGGFGIGTKNTSESADNKIQAKSLNIIYKPKPKYTDFARFYNISGNVRVRTTFSKDGTISSAVPISKLPFGLTKSAVTAAKQIRFEPQIQNGQKVSVTKVVVFTFTIY